MDKRYLTAFIVPNRWPVYGYNLKPYCAKHHVFLQSVKSPFLTMQVPHPSETIHFLKVCSQEDYEFMFMRRTMWDSIMYLRMKVDPYFHAEVVKRIMNYILEYCSGPKFAISMADGEEVIAKNSDIPDMLMLASMCMAKLGMTEHEALTTPIGRLSWYSASIAILNGGKVRLISTEEEENAKSDLEKLAQHEREMAERLRLAMVNGKVKTRPIKLSSEQP